MNNYYNKIAVNSRKSSYKFLHTAEWCSICPFICKHTTWHHKRGDIGICSCANRRVALRFYCITLRFLYYLHHYNLLCIILWYVILRIFYAGVIVFWLDCRATCNIESVVLMMFYINNILCRSFRVLRHCRLPVI